MKKGLNLTFLKGLKDGVPIGLGYLSVAFTFGMMAVTGGLPVGTAVLISMSNVTSAGQFAGLSLILSGTTVIEMALTQLVINLRYALMSLSLSQKLDKTFTVLDRLIVSFVNTDEVFAVASSQEGEVGRRYLYGLILAPYFGWALGTLLGAAAGQLLPSMLQSALGIAIYGMFIAIIIPPAKRYQPVAKVIVFSVILSCVLRWTPVLNKISTGFAIIICTLLASVYGALKHPIKEAE